MPTKTKPHNEQSQIGQKLPYFTHPAQRAQLSMIATPLGNLGDISKRTLEVLQACDELWCEDTRHTQALLSALKLPSKLLRRVDQHTGLAEIESLIKDADKRRHHVGVVCDAGTPGISDPGAKIIEIALQYPEVKITPIPGPSAVAALMSISGVHENAFAFLGFFPREEKEATGLLTNILRQDFVKAFVFFESPNRIVDTITFLSQWTKNISETHEGEVDFVFAKEISKIHETVMAGRGSEFLHAILHQHFDEPERTKGEWCFLINISKLNVKNQEQNEEWVLALECLISAGISTKEAASLISQRFSIAKNLAYKKALTIKPAKK